MFNRIYRNDPDRVTEESRRAAQIPASVAELGRLIPRALDPEKPDRAEDLARIGRQAASLSPAELEAVLESVPRTGAEPVRAALRRPGARARSTPTDSIEVAPDLGPFANGRAPGGMRQRVDLRRRRLPIRRASWPRWRWLTATRRPSTVSVWSPPRRLRRPCWPALRRRSH